MISNSNIESAFHAGGLLGTVSTPTYINGAIVEGTKVESTGENGIAGGIVAVATNPEERTCEVSIENSEVRAWTNSEDANAVAKQSEVKALNHAGGMIGFTTVGEIKDSKVLNSKVTSTNGISGAFAGVVSLTTSEINAQADAAENGTTYTGRTVSKLMLSGSTIADVILAGLNYVNDYLGCGIIE